MRSSRLFPFVLLVAGAQACGAEAPMPPVAPPEPAPTIRAPAFGVPPPEPASERRVLEVRIAPVVGSAGAREIDHLEVAIGLSEPPGELADPLSLWLARSEGAEEGWADAIEEMYARDAEGALTLRTRAPAAEGSATGPVGAHVEWRSDRRPAGPIRLGYRVKLTRSDAGHFHGTRAHARGFEGTGATFLVLPETPDTYRTRLTWDLAGAGEGASAISTMGAEASGPMQRLREASFMAGPLGRLSIDDGGARFEGAWLGHTAFDPVEALPWLARVRAAGRALFHDADGAAGSPAPGARTDLFTVLVRAVPGIGPVFQGSAPSGGLRILAGEEMGFTRGARFHWAREIVRRWIGGDTGLRFDGADHAAPALSWLVHGLEVHFAREVLLRSGLATVDEVAEDLRERLDAAAAAAEPPKAAREPAPRPGAVRIAEHAGAPAVETVARGGGPWVGMLYAADLDAAVRARSGGKRSLDDLVLGLLAKARAGARPDGTVPPLPAAAFPGLVEAELGPEGEARFDAAARGEPKAPPPEAFGPCFKREDKKARGGKGAGVTGHIHPPEGHGPPAFVWVRDPRAAATCARRGAR